MHYKTGGAFRRALEDRLRTQSIQSTPLPEETHGARYSVRSLLDSRGFESFHVDIGVGDPVTSPADILATPPILAFAEISPTLIPCYPLTQHLAEKLHAYTRPHPAGESSRVKDLVDILLIIQDNRIEAGLLRQSIQATFAIRKTHPLPVTLPEPPPGWAQPYRKFAAEVGLRSSDLQTGFVEASQFINPILSGRDSGEWHPKRQVWE